MAESPPVTFAGLLRQLRTDAGLTQEELAQAASLSVRSISDLERGINLTARKDSARLLAQALNLAGPARTAFEAVATGRAPAEGFPAAGEAAVGVTRAPPPPPPQAPPPARPPAVHTLPRDIASFTGRMAELDQLLKDLSAGVVHDASSTVGVHVIDGMPGIGKTTFAVHAAHRLAPLFPDGQYFLSLHSHTPGQRPVDPGAALGTLLLATGTATHQIPDDLDARAMLWRSVVADKKVLLVLDDAASHHQVRPLLPGSPGNLVLITSRRRLAAVEGALPISLDTLPPEDAAKLFTQLTDRAGSEADAVAAITRLCGYLPLAIRLVAGTLRGHPSWTVADLAADLAEAQDRLEEMHAENLSVAAAFDLSYADLNGDQQRLFRRLGLHPGTTIDAYAAAALDTVSPAAARHALDDLYDQHLITEPVRGRYRMHDLISEHARSLATRDDPAERAEATGRLLDYYLHAAAAAHRLIARRPPADIPATASRPTALPELKDRDDAMAWLAAERSNLHACAEHAAAHGWTVHAVWIPIQIGGFLRIRGYWDEAVTLHQRAAAVARACGDRVGLAAAVDDLAKVQYLRGDHSAAAASLTEALDLTRELGDRLGQAEALIDLGFQQITIDDYPAAAASLGEGLELHRSLGDRQGQATALNCLAILYRCTGDYQRAIEPLGQALALYQDLGNRIGQANVLSELGTVQGLMGDSEAATAALLQALALCAELGAKHCHASSLASLGAVQRRSGNRDAASSSLAEAVTLYHDLGDRQGEAGALNELGALLAGSARPGPGLDQHTEALRLARAGASLREEAQALEGSGLCQLRLGDPAAAQTCLRSALRIYEQIGSPGAARVRQMLDGMRRVV